VQITTTIGSNITYQFVTKQIGDYMSKKGRSLVKIIIRVAYRESDLN